MLILFCCVPNFVITGRKLIQQFTHDHHQSRIAPTGAVSNHSLDNASAAVSVDNTALIHRDADEEVHENIQHSSITQLFTLLAKNDKMKTLLLNLLFCIIAIAICIVDAINMNESEKNNKVNNEYNAISDRSVAPLVLYSFACKSYNIYMYII